MKARLYLNIGIDLSQNKIFLNFNHCLMLLSKYCCIFIYNLLMIFSHIRSTKFYIQKLSFESSHCNEIWPEKIVLHCYTLICLIWIRFFSNNYGNWKYTMFMKWIMILKFMHNVYSWIFYEGLVHDGLEDTKLCADNLKRAITLAE